MAKQKEVKKEEFKENPPVARPVDYIVPAGEAIVTDVKN